MIYRVVEGLFDESESSYFTGDPLSAKAEYASFDEALLELGFHSTMQDHKLTPTVGGLYCHIPGVEGVYTEDWYQQNCHQSKVWLIRRVDNIAYLN